MLVFPSDNDLFTQKRKNRTSFHHYLLIRERCIKVYVMYLAIEFFNVENGDIAKFMSYEELYVR